MQDRYRREREQANTGVCGKKERDKERKEGRD